VKNRQHPAMYRVMESADRGAINSSLTAQHHNAFDRSDCLHGPAVSPPESQSKSRGAGGYPRWSVFGSRSIALSAPSPNDGAGFHQPQPMRRFSADVLPLRPMNSS